MTFEEYNPTVMDHFLNPRNTGELKNASCGGSAENPACGDLVKLTMIVKDGIIRDARAKTFGCAAAIAAASVLTELLIGNTLTAAAALTDQDVLKRLGGLPEHKVKCSLVTPMVVGQALEDYRVRTP